MNRLMRALAASAVVALAGVSGGCAGYGWQDVLYDAGGVDGMFGGEVRGEVLDVHERYRVIRLRRDDRRDVSVRYDSRTDVIYRDRRYRPESLDRGDYVTMRVSRDRRGDLYARSVHLRRDRYDDRYGDRDRDRRDRDRVPDRRDDAGRYDARAAEGRVGRIQRSEGRFEMRAEGRTFWVTLPYNPNSRVRERFQRLRQGDYVHVRGRFVTSNQFQLESFR